MNYSINRRAGYSFKTNPWIYQLIFFIRMRQRSNGLHKIPAGIDKELLTVQ
ncbi:MAG: hypothetical protein WBN27_01860 [Eudoraea sp.]|uniref:hypothetical protein n=1 Tax=Eudoraea sp. TaxID=1979955 RepID=UPI003C7162CC